MFSRCMCLYHTSHILPLLNIKLSGLSVSARPMATHLSRTSEDSRSRKILTAEVTRMHKLDHDVLGVTVLCQEPGDSYFYAGQWIDVFLPGVEIITGFSMISPPHQYKEHHTLDLAVKYSTYPPTHWMHTQCHVGSEFQMRFGGDFSFQPEKNETDLLLLAGGVGVNPLISILKETNHVDTLNPTCRRKICMLHSAKTEEGLLFKNELVSISKRESNFSLKFHLTSSTHETLHANVQESRIVEGDLRLALQDLTNPQIYICGPPSMISSLNRSLQDLGVKSNNINFEKWMDD